METHHERRVDGANPVQHLLDGRLVCPHTFCRATAHGLPLGRAEIHIVCAILHSSAAFPTALCTLSSRRR